MIRLSASLSKKLPVPGVSFSSQQFGASLEIEVSDADKPEAIKARIKSLYGLLAQSIDEQVAAEISKARPVGTSKPAGDAKSVSLPPNTAKPGGNGYQRFIPSTAAQQKAIVAIAKDLGVPLASVLGRHGVAEVGGLGIKQASAVIDELKAQRAAKG